MVKRKTVKKSGASLVKKVAIGAAGVAVAAGAVVAGITLSDKKNRKKLQKGAAALMDSAEDIVVATAEKTNESVGNVQKKVTAEVKKITK